ncbi:lysozyme inhibitor LprI family protein [Clostridium sp.]|uniref:lysozyme inhibitor LprI family protein n=1 Tax=Clostridium sp. TaxID=1506 RepID=UPI003F349D70
MNKLIKSTFYISIISTFFLIGCTSQTPTKEADFTKKEDTSQDLENQVDDILGDKLDVLSEGVNDINNASNDIEMTKNEYIEDLNNLESNLDLSLKDDYDSGVTSQMLEAASKEFEEWDKKLNEIYTSIQLKLPEDEGNKLIEEELNWIKSRDEKSEAAANEFKGGTMESLNKVMSLINSTKERCYDLLHKYY